MHTKILDPKRHVRQSKANYGSAKQSVNYLMHEQLNQKAAVFFSKDTAQIKPVEVIASLDANQGKLSVTQEKFYSVVLSPSREEIRMTPQGNDWREFTRECLKNYAHTFNLKQKVDYEALLWYAVVHEARKEKEARKQQGSILRESMGEHAHVHVLISALNKNQQQRLHPRNKKKHFHMRDFALRNQETFENMYGHSQHKTVELLQTHPLSKRQQDMVMQHVEKVNRFYEGTQNTLNGSEVIQMAQNHPYGKDRVFNNIRKLSSTLSEGGHIKDPYTYLNHGKEINGERSIEPVAGQDIKQALTDRIGNYLQEERVRQQIERMRGKEDQNQFLEP